MISVEEVRLDGAEVECSLGRFDLGLIKDLQVAKEKYESHKGKQDNKAVKLLLYSHVQVQLRNRRNTKVLP